MPADLDIVPPELVCFIDKFVCFIIESGAGSLITPSQKQKHERSLPFIWSDNMFQMPLFASWKSKVQMFCRNPNSWTLKNGGYNASETENIIGW